MADTITRRLVNKVQTEGAAAAERDLAKVEQAGAKAGAGIAGGMDKAAAATDKASANIEGKLDGLGKAFAATDKASELIGKIGTAFGLVGAAAALAAPVVSAIGQVIADAGSASRAAAADLELAKTATDALSSSLGSLSLTIDEKVLRSLEAVGRATKRAEEDITRSRDRITALQVAQENGVSPEWLERMGLARPGETAEEAIARNESRLETAKQFYKRSARVLEEGIKEIKDAAEKKSGKAGKAPAESPYQDLLGMAEFIGTQQLVGLRNIARAILPEPEAEDGGVALIKNVWRSVREEVELTTDSVVDLYGEIDARSAEALASTRAMADGFGSAAEALSSVALSAALSGDSIVEAVGKSMAASALDYAAKAIGFGAQGLFLLAFGDAAGAAAAGTAAVQAAAAAAAFGAGAAALGGFSGGGGGGGGGEAPSTESLTGRRETERGGGGVTVNVNFSGQPLITDRAITEAIGRGVSEASRTRGNAIYGRLN